MSANPHNAPWSATLLRKARGIHSEIGALQQYAAQTDAEPLSSEAAAGLFRGHYALLDDLYLNQLPYALAAEGADFFLGYRGPTTVRERAGLGQMNRLFTTLRAEVGGLAESVSRAEDETPKSESFEDEAEEEGDLRVGCCLPGLCVGFSIPEGTAGEVWTEAIGHLGFAADCLTSRSENEAEKTLATGIADPRVRDAAVGALRKLFPHRDKGIEGLELRGRLLPSTSPILFDRAAWQKAGALLGRPLAAAAPSEPVTFVGRLLQIDYELRRFELREIETEGTRGRIPSIRCAYSPALDAVCEGAARKRIEVRGRSALAGRDTGGKVPRLIEVESLRVIPE